MTMPHLMNCPHSGSGWCLDCVAKLYEQKNSCIVKFPISEDLIETAKKAGQDGVRIWYGRPVITAEMAALMDCPFPPYYSKDEIMTIESGGIIINAPTSLVGKYPIESVTENIPGGPKLKGKI